MSKREIKKLILKMEKGRHYTAQELSDLSRLSPKTISGQFRGDPHIEIIRLCPRQANLRAVYRRTF